MWKTHISIYIRMLKCDARRQMTNELRNRQMCGGERQRNEIAQKRKKNGAQQKSALANGKSIFRLVFKYFNLRARPTVHTMQAAATATASVAAAIVVVIVCMRTEPFVSRSFTTLNAFLPFVLLFE